MNNAYFEQFKKDFKRDVLVKVVIGLKYGKFSKKYAKDLAREVVGIFEEEVDKEIFSKINKLSERHPEVLDAFIKRGFEYDEREKNDRLNQIIVYLSKGGGEAN